MQVPCTPHIPAGHCALFDELPSTQRLAAWPNGCNNVDSDSIPAMPISPIPSSRFTRIGTEMTYSNTCDPARPPAESQRSITSQILIPRIGTRKKKCTHAADQSSATLLRDSATALCAVCPGAVSVPVAGAVVGWLSGQGKLPSCSWPRGQSGEASPSTAPAHRLAPVSPLPTG